MLGHFQNLSHEGPTYNLILPVKANGVPTNLEFMIRSNGDKRIKTLNSVESTPQTLNFL